MAQVDPAVTRRKFENALGQLAAQRPILDARGIFLVGTPTYPSIELVFVPRRPLQFAVPITQSGSIFLPPGTSAIGTAGLPNLAARAFKAHFELSDFDLRAPSLQFRDPWTDELLDYNTMFRAFEYEKHRQVHLVLLGDHPTERRPFLCLRGIREYHEHPQHSGDDWLQYRNDISFFSIVMSVWRACIDLPQPTLIQQSTGVVQVQWSAEEKS